MPLAALVGGGGGVGDGHGGGGQAEPRMRSQCTQWKRTEHVGGPSWGHGGALGRSQGPGIGVLGSVSEAGLRDVCPGAFISPLSLVTEHGRQLPGGGRVPGRPHG